MQSFSPTLCIARVFCGDRAQLTATVAIRLLNKEEGMGAIYKATNRGVNMSNELIEFSVQ